jgi:predicted negative regulator of RcsB-dependent stress response
MAEPRPTGEDRFVAATLKILNWAQNNTRALILSLGAVAIVVFGVRYYIDYQQRLREAAATEIQSIRFQAQSGDASQTVEQLRSYLVRFSGTPYAREARVLLAHSLLLGNRASEAIEPARQAIDELGKDPLSTRAAFLLAAAYEETADTAAAISVYEAIGERVKRRSQKSRGLEGAARLRAASGDRAGAARVYDQLVALTPEDAVQRQLYEMRAAEMRAAAGPQETVQTVEAAQAMRPGEEGGAPEGQ